VIRVWWDGLQSCSGQVIFVKPRTQKVLVEQMMKGIAGQDLTQKFVYNQTDNIDSFDSWFKTFGRPVQSAHPDFSTKKSSHRAEAASPSKGAAAAAGGAHSPAPSSAKLITSHAELEAAYTRLDGWQNEIKHLDTEIRELSKVFCCLRLSRGDVVREWVNARMSLETSRCDQLRLICLCISLVALEDAVHD
jgi:hypothetical protein